MKIFCKAGPEWFVINFQCFFLIHICECCNTWNYLHSPDAWSLEFARYYHSLQEIALDQNSKGKKQKQWNLCKGWSQPIMDSDNILLTAWISKIQVIKLALENQTIADLSHTPCLHLYMDDITCTQKVWNTYSHLKSDLVSSSGTNLGAKIDPIQLNSIVWAWGIRSSK